MAELGWAGPSEDEKNEGGDTDRSTVLSASFLHVGKDILDPKNPSPCRISRDDASKHGT